MSICIYTHPLRPPPPPCAPTPQAKQARGANPYPHKFGVTCSLPEFIEKYSGLAAGEQLKDVTVSLAGVQGGWEEGVWPGMGRPLDMG